MVNCTKCGASNSATGKDGEDWLAQHNMQFHTSEAQLQKSADADKVRQFPLDSSNSLPDLMPRSHVIGFLSDFREAIAKAIES